MNQGLKERNLQIYKRYVEDKKTLRDIANEFGVTPGRASQIIKQVKKELAHAS